MNRENIVEQTIEKIADIVIEVLEINEKDIMPDTSIQPKNLMDTNQTEIIMKIEDEFDIEIPDEDIEKLNTVIDLIEYIMARPEIKITHITEKGIDKMIEPLIKIINRFAAKHIEHQDEELIILQDPNGKTLTLQEELEKDD